MLTISNKEQLERYKRERALVTLFLDSGYTSKNIEIVMNAKCGFDAQVGPAWHMLIPYKTEGYAVDAPLSSESYGIDLSRQAINEQGISTTKLPVVLFENYDGDGDYFYVSLAGLNEDEMVRTIGEIADIVVDEHKNGRKDPNDYRLDITTRVKAHTNIKRLISIAKRGASTAIAATLGLLD